MKQLIERLLIRILKKLNTDLLAHAHVQIGAGHNTYNSGEENVIKKILNKALKRDPEIIFDVGANTGEYALQLAAQFKEAKIYCFEPIPDNFKKLTLNTAGLNTINIQTAMGSTPGNFNIYLGDNNTDGSMATIYKEAIDHVFQFAGETNSCINCPVITMDDFCADKIATIDFLKIDVEGHELEILKGAVQLIENNRINIIQFEFNEFNIFSRSFMCDFYHLLNRYDFYRIMPQNKLYPMCGYNSSLEIFRYQNILAIHKSLHYIND